MQARVLALVGRLRDAGVDVSVAETMDATRAVAAAGVEREVLREALAATLVKVEADRPAFDPIFEALFPLVGARSAVGERKRRPTRSGGASWADAARRGRGEGTAAQPPAQPPQREVGRETPGPHRRAAAADQGDAEGARARRARVHALVTCPFQEFTARDVVEVRDLVRELGRRLRGRLARRERRGRRGRLDFRRTIRAATAHGGVPLRLRFRTRRPGRPDLLALCDLSGSVAAASELCLGLVAPAAPYFRRTDLFAFVDRLCPVSIEGGHVAPGGPLDLYARSNFGRVLEDLWRDHRDSLGRGTIVLVLGDARNNRRPPRPDLLRAIRDRVKTIVWLVPEPQARWDTGDSVLRLYAPACDAVVECLDLAALVRAVRAAL
jgi:uncharacterized protein with von Willebrand factor type A (vWA) domain